MSLQAALIATLVPYVAIAAAGWRGARLHQRRLDALPEEAPPAPQFGLGRTPLQVEQIAVEDAVTAALGDVDRLAAVNLTGLLVAVDGALLVRADPLALRVVLADMISGAVRRAPCGTVLVAARRHGGRIEVSVIDDGAAGALDATAGLNSSSQEILALHGATLEARPGAGGGTEISMRLLAPPARVRPAPTVQAALAQDTKPAQDAKRNSVVERSERSSSSSEVGTV